jgi:replicative DNA helicase
MSVKKLYKKVKELLDSIYDESKRMEFLPMGFKRVDEHLDGGLLKKELIVVGAFTGVGKSYFAGQITMNLAFQGFKTAYFSTEISSETVISRMIGALSNIKSTRIIAGFLSNAEKEKQEEATAKLLTSGDFFRFYDDLYDLEEIKKEVVDNDYDFVVIDFIQNVFCKNMPDEYSRLSYIALQLQKLAKDADCCMFVLSQLSNQAAKKTTHEVLEYKGSGNIATVCDLGFIMTRGSDNEFKLRLQKNRRGGSGRDITLMFKQPGGWIYETGWIG